MKFTEIHNSVIGLWPEEIRIDDNGVPSSSAEGHYFPNLSEAWDKVEKVVGTDDERRGLMAWTHFICFHRLAMSKVRKGYSCILRSEVELRDIEAQYRSNLQVDKSWQS